MNIKSYIKKISYNPVLIKTARFLGLRNILRKLYFATFRPSSDILDAKINDVTIKLRVRNPDELRLAEAVSGAGGEGPVLGALLPSLKAGDVALDVGANIGVYALFFAKVVGEKGKVIAFEPEEKSFVHLQDNVSINNLHNVVLVKEALGEEAGKAKLYIGKTTGHFSLLKSYEETNTFQEISIVNGDDYLAKNSMPVPKAIKIDVEGYEFSVLMGLKKTLAHPECKIICCEVHPGLFPDNVTEETILNFIQSLGFKNIQTFKRAFSAYHVICKKD